MPTGKIKTSFPFACPVIAWNPIRAKPVFNGRFTNRFRFEERFIQNKSLNSYPLSTRFRYQIGFNMPLQGKMLDVKEFYLNTENEEINKLFENIIEE